MGIWLPGPGPTSGNDIFGGDDTDETASAGDGDDGLDGAGGNDVLNGDAGNDHLSWSLGNDTLNGGEGDDWIWLIGSGQTATLTLVGGSGTDLLQLNTSFTTLAPGSSISGIETLAMFGSVTLDPSLLTGFSNIYGQGISGIVLSAPGVVDLSAVNMPASFTIHAGTNLQQTINDANIFLTGSLGNDTLIMPSAAGARIGINGFHGNDTITGSGAADQLTGGGGNDVVHGGAGNDRIDWWEDGGNDAMFGDEGDDFFWISSPTAAGVLTIDGGIGNDTIAFGDATILAGSSFTNIETFMVLSGVGPGPGLGFLHYAPQLLYGSAIFLANGAGGLFPTSAGVTDLSSMTMPASFEWRNATYSNSVRFEGTSGADTLLIPLAGLATVGANGNDGADTLSGGGAIDILSGGAGNDTLTGNAGNDRLNGGGGNDIINYAVGDGADQIDGGSFFSDFDRISITDGIGASSLSVAVSNGVVIGIAGGTVANIDQVDANLGGGGDWLLYVANQPVTVNLGAGTASAFISIAGITNVAGGSGNDSLTGDGAANTLSGMDGADALIGGTGDDTLLGGAANDTLNGGLGGDSLIGGLGNDTYVVDSEFDVTIEFSGEGTDLVQSSVTWSLAAELENLTLIGVAAINGSGNELANALVGNSALNELFGNGGDDTLDGGAGGDSLIGGIGNDTFVVDSDFDVVTEIAGEGTDLVQSTITWTLGAELENLTLIGAAAINGSGNELANMLIGNSALNELFGNGGDDSLNGGVGADHMFGGAGDDTYFIDNSADVTFEGSALDGVDTVLSSVTRALGANFENLTLTGAVAIIGAGNGLNNVITGNEAVNTLFGQGGDDVLNGAGGADILHGNAGADTVDGGTGADTMYGGAGDDAYVVDSGGDITFEGSALDGTDIVFSSVTRSLGPNLENLTLTGAAAINGGGNALANIMIGNNAINALFGNAGDDTLDGGAGADKMYGAAGDDTYVVDNTSDVTFEGSALDGVDLVQSSVTRSLGANLENLTLTGTASINGVGNSLGNVINGNSGANQLFGNLGDDVLNGGAGNDVLNGAGGNDSFVFAPGSGSDIVNNFLAGGVDDSLDFSVYSGTGITWTITQVGANTVFDFSNGDQITLTNVIAANLMQTDPFGFG